MFAVFKIIRLFDYYIPTPAGLNFFERMSLYDDPLVFKAIYDLILENFDISYNIQENIFLDGKVRKVCYKVINKEIDLSLPMFAYLFV